MGAQLQCADNLGITGDNTIFKATTSYGLNFCALRQTHFFSLAGQLTTNEKVCALVVSG